jgi:hypothetical protein
MEPPFGHGTSLSHIDVPGAPFPTLLSEFHGLPPESRGATARRGADGSNVQRPSLQGAVTYTADGRFHFITTRTDAPKLASSDPSRPSPEEDSPLSIQLQIGNQKFLNPLH